MDPSGQHIAVPGPSKAAPPIKPRISRASRACLYCRNLKMKCHEDEGGVCKRCRLENLDCVFPESQRGKHGKGGRKRVQIPPAGTVVGGAGPLQPSPQQASAGIPVFSLPHNIQVDSNREPSYSPVSHGGESASTLAPTLFPAEFAELLGAALPNMHHNALELNYVHNTNGQDYHSFLSNNNNNNGHAEQQRPFAGSTPEQPTIVLERSPDGGTDSTDSPDGSTQDWAPQAILRAEGRRISQTGERPPHITAPSGAYYEQTALADLTDRRGNAIVSGYYRYPPKILEFVATSQVVQYFDYFFTHLHPHFPMLCPTLHTPDEVTARSPLLLTAICAIASSHMEPGSEVAVAMADIVTELSFSAPSRGSKTVEICQANILLSVWSVGNSTDDNTNVRLALAIAIAQDCGLDQLKLSGPERAALPLNEFHNRARTCLSTQLGTYPTTGDSMVTRVPEHFLMGSSHLQDWCSTSQIALLRILKHTLAVLRDGTSTMGVARPATYAQVIANFSDQVLLWRQQMSLSRQTAPPSDGPQKAWLDLYYNYARLVVYSHGLKEAHHHGNQANIDAYQLHCYAAGTSVLSGIQDDFSARSWLRSLPDFTFPIIVYAGVTLLRLCRPRARPFHINVPSVMDALHSCVDTIENTPGTPSQASGRHAALLSKIIRAHEQGTGIDAETPFWPYGSEGFGISA